MSVIDLSQPLSAILKEGTKKVHEELETSVAATAIIRGELDKEEYARYLMMLWHVYDTFERALERHASHPVLEPTYNPTLLSRAPALAADICTLLNVHQRDWKSHRVHIQLTAAMPPQLTEYTSHIESLGNTAPARLLAHAYVRYLGDLSGGQTIQRALAKAYGLTVGGAGLEFYKFKELRSQKTATQGELKRIKDWFRAGMDKGAGDDQEVKAAILDEAQLVFELNGGIFEAVRTTPEKGRVVFESTDPNAPKTYPLASVMSVVLAVCLAHFLLTVFGFTGERGYEKLLVVEEWLMGPGKPPVRD